MAVSKGDIPYMQSEDDGHDDKPQNILCHSLPLSIPGVMSNKAHGPLGCDMRRSVQLQQAVDALSLKEVLGIEFSVTLADPKIPDCPLVACSIGFSKLTHYNLEEIIGKNCRFLLDGVPLHFIDESIRFKSRAFCRAAVDGFGTKEWDEDLPDGLKQEKPFLKLSSGELLCVQTNARKSGELFRNMFYLKTVELDEEEFIVGLQAGLDEDFDGEGVQGQDLRDACAQAFGRLDKNMSAVERVLASCFCYSSAMRRG